MAGCDAFAGAVVKGNAAADGCVAGGASCASKIAEIFQNDEISLGNVARILKIENREYFTKLDNLSKPEENEEEKYNWCPIGPKYKNFM